MGVVKRSSWALFVSGAGSNLQALIDENSDQIRVVVCNHKSAAAVLKAKRAGLLVLFIEKNSDWTQLSAQLKEFGVHMIFLLGFMKIIPAPFLKSWQGQIINLHPSLLPAYPGLFAIERSFQEQAEMGVTVHHVTEEVDAGAVILQKKIERPDSFAHAQLRISSAEQKVIRSIFNDWKCHESVHS